MVVFLLEPLPPFCLVPRAFKCLQVLSKAMAVFVTLCNEFTLLCKEAERDYYGPLHLYGDSCAHTPLEEGEVQLLFGRTLPLLQRLSVFVDRVNQVVKNAVQQLAMVYSPAQQQRLDMRDVTLDPVLKQLGRALMCLAVIDHVVVSNQTLNDHLQQYRRMLRTVTAKPQLFNLTAENLQPLQRLFSKLSGQLFEGMIFQVRCFPCSCTAAFGLCLLHLTRPLRAWSVSVSVSMFVFVFVSVCAIVATVQTCIDQPFDDATVMVTGNEMFRRKFLESLGAQLQDLGPCTTHRDTHRH